MCQLISGIAVKSGDTIRVYTLLNSDSHNDIREYHNIRDDGGVGERQTPIEYVPGTRLDDSIDWEFRFDDERPNWWVDNMTETAKCQLWRAYRARWNGNTYSGNLNLRSTPITALPDGLSVCGNINLYGTPITTLPDGLSVCGNINLYGTPITVLPDGLTVGGDLDLRGTGITDIPSTAKICGEVWR